MTHTLKELADIGARAAFTAQMAADQTCATRMDSADTRDEPARQAFAQAVRDAVEKPLRDEITVMGAKIAELEKPSHQTYSLEMAQYIVEVAKRLVTKSDSLPTTKTIPLDIGDIRATDEFRVIEDEATYTPQAWTRQIVRLTTQGGHSYEFLAANYLRRQHGSNEWKPCTKEISANQQ